jgi:hypothetical protein
MDIAAVTSNGQPQHPSNVGWDFKPRQTSTAMTTKTTKQCRLCTFQPWSNEILRLIGSHNLFATPSAAQLADKELRPLIRAGAHLPPGVGLRRLASRNEQYERFYLASSPRNLARHLGFTDRSRADRLVDRFLKEPY